MLRSLVQQAGTPAAGPMIPTGPTHVTLIKVAHKTIQKRSWSSLSTAEVWQFAILTVGGPSIAVFSCLLPPIGTRAVHRPATGGDDRMRPVP